MQTSLLKCFGVGDGWPSARNHSAFLYRIDKITLLIDCGEPLSRSLQLSGFDYNLLDAIFLSHLHFDHIGGLLMLMQVLWLKRRTKALTVHLPADGIAPIRQMLQAGCIFDELLSFRLRFKPLARVELGRVRITPFPTTHLETFRRRFAKKYPQNYAAFCFMIEAGTLRVGHSADIGAPEDLSPLLREPLDLLVCELAHINPGHLFTFLKGRPIRRIVFIHLTQKQIQSVEKLRSLAATQLPGMQFSFAADGDEIAF